MAHTAIHFSLGLLLASALRLPRLVAAWRAGKRIAGQTATWLILSYALGVYSIVPSLLNYGGLSDQFCAGWWMNVFLLHPLLGKVKSGGTVLGPTLLITCFTAQYAILIAAIIRSRRRWRP